MRQAQDVSWEAMEAVGGWRDQVGLVDDQVSGEGRGWCGPMALSSVEKMWERGGLVPLGASMPMSGSWDLAYLPS